MLRDGCLGRDVHALAVTGSAARGDATVASDLDLWAIVDTCAAPMDFVVDDTPVSCFFETDELLADLTHLITVEAQYAVVLKDPRGDFARARALADTKRTTLMRASRENLRAHLRGVQMEHAGLLSRLSATRRIADDVLTLAMLNHGERRRPKVRELKRRFGADVAAAYDTVQGVHRLPDDAALAQVWATRPALLDAARRDGADFGVLDNAQVALSSTARKLLAGERGDAILAARTWFERVVRGPWARRGGEEKSLPQALYSDMTMWWGAADASRSAVAEADEAVRAMVEALRARHGLDPEDGALTLARLSRPAARA